MEKTPPPHHPVLLLGPMEKMCSPACLLAVCTAYSHPHSWSSHTFSLRGCCTVPFIWLSGKGFYSQVLFCSQKWLYKREPFNFTYIFPGYQNCIYLFQWLRYTCTISIPLTSAEQIQLKRSWLLFPIVCGQQSWCLSPCIYSSASA